MIIKLFERHEAMNCAQHMQERRRAVIQYNIRSTIAFKAVLRAHSSRAIWNKKRAQLIGFIGLKHKMKAKCSCHQALFLIALIEVILLPNLTLSTSSKTKKTAKKSKAEVS